MDELVKRSDVLSAYYDDFYSHDYFPFEDVLNSVPAVDAVRVIRCKDCKWLYDGMDDYCCRNHRGLVCICENSYCSHGERRTND